jgi:NADH:ubiquinone oxidoreductase subunit 5 (subunit L)/multisubunit Na+/H+ antiporter MnhA subunit
MTRLLLIGAAIVSAAASVCFLVLFERFYWRYRSLFDEQGRYFDEATSVVYHEQAYVLAIPAAALLLLTIFFGILWWIHRR